MDHRMFFGNAYQVLWPSDVTEGLHVTACMGTYVMIDPSSVEHCSFGNYSGHTRYPSHGRHNSSKRRPKKLESLQKSFHGSIATQKRLKKFSDIRRIGASQNRELKEVVITSDRRNDSHRANRVNLLPSPPVYLRIWKIS